MYLTRNAYWNGNRYPYLSPGGRNISRTIKTSEKDFEIKLKNLLIVISPTKTISWSILSPNNRQNISFDEINSIDEAAELLDSSLEKLIRLTNHDNSPSKMCVKCGKIFRPISWSGWDLKYLTTKNVYICEDCYPKLKNIIQKEKVKRSLHEKDIEVIKTKKSKIKTLSNISIISYVPIALIVLSTPLIPIIIITNIIFPFLVVYLLIKRKAISKLIHEREEAESHRRNIVLNSVKRYDGSLLEKKNMNHA